MGQLADGTSAAFPITQMSTVQWYATRDTRLEYRPVGDGAWSEVSGTAMRVPDTDRVVHTVHLSGLTGDSRYEFRLPDTDIPAVYTTYADDPTTTLVVHWHSLQPLPTSGDYTTVPLAGSWTGYTLPAAHPTVFKVAAIADTHGTVDRNAKMLADIGARDVDLTIHAGDMANGDGGASTPATWYTLFDAIDGMRKPNGDLIPFIPCIGNHEIWGGSSGVSWSSVQVGRKPDFDLHRRGDAEWYYCFFPAFPGLTGYGLLDVGSWLSVWTLDPGISTPIDGNQKQWLDETLAARDTVTHRLPTLHYSPWPAGRRPMVNYFTGTRNHFASLFEDHGVKLVLVGHDHVWSKTVKIKGGDHFTNDPDVPAVSGADPDGVRYIGSGPCGASARSGRTPAAKWWIDDSVTGNGGWTYYAYEQDGWGGAGSGLEEFRHPHPDDHSEQSTSTGDESPWTDEQVRNWWLLELEPTKRTLKAINYDDTVFDEFEDEVDYAPE